jgi:D-alanyl-D-alanine carboxypeptidase
MTRPSRLLVLLTLHSAVAVGAGYAQSPVDTAAIDSLIRATVEKHQLVGLSVGVAQGDRIVFTRGYGLRSLERRDSVTPATLFAIGSVTKQFTCASVLLLAEDGRLSLQDRVAKYLPRLTRAGDITLLDLGQHVAGYRDYYPLDFVDREMQRPVTADDVIAEYATRPLDFEPGTRWSYSNTSFVILGKVVAMVAGEPFARVLETRIFGPLDMRHTRYEPPGVDSSMARGYTSFALGPAMPAAPEGRGWLGAAGGIWSTPADLLAWDLALVGGKVLSPESYRTMTTPRRLADGRTTGYGCGEGVSDRGDAVVLSHSGGVSGFVAWNAIVPASRSAVVLLANSDAVYHALDRLGKTIVGTLIPPGGTPSVSAAVPADAARTFLQGLQAGSVDRSTLGADFDAFLTPDMLRRAQRSLGGLGPIGNVQVTGTYERGGMEVAVLRFPVGAESARGLMYRTPDGRIQELLIFRD